MDWFIARLVRIYHSLSASNVPFVVCSKRDIWCCFVVG